MNYKINNFSKSKPIYNVMEEIILIIYLKSANLHLDDFTCLLSLSTLVQWSEHGSLKYQTKDFFDIWVTKVVSVIFEVINLGTLG